MDIFKAQPNTLEKATALKAIMEVLKIDYCIEGDEKNIDNKIFSAEIKECKQQAKNDHTVDHNNLITSKNQKTLTTPSPVKELKHNKNRPSNQILLLQSIINNMVEGKSIPLLPSDSQVSTQQAAEILNVSRKQVVKLLEQGEIPFVKIGTLRKIKLSDLLAYQATFKKLRRRDLNILSEEAQALGLGYE